MPPPGNYNRPFLALPDCSCLALTRADLFKPMKTLMMLLHQLRLRFDVATMEMRWIQASLL